MSADDDAVLEAQLGRPSRGASKACARCHLGLPTVVSVPPHLDDGTPFPTRYWLSCPLAHHRVAQLEAAGGVRDYEERVRSDAAFADALVRAHRRYAEDRDRLLRGSGDGPKPRGGVAGIADPSRVKCLHAHFADHLAGNANPVGAAVAADVLPLDCAVACVVVDGGRACRNASWRPSDAPRAKDLRGDPPG